MIKVNETYGYAEWIIIAIVAIYLFKYLKYVRHITNFWVLAPITIIIICLGLTILRIILFGKDYNISTIDDFIVNFLYILPSVILISLFTIVIKFRPYRNKI